MTDNNQIWLKPKPAHIDENFESFLDYLKSNSDKSSLLYQESVNLLRERVDILINERFQLPIYRHSADIGKRQFNVRLCGAWLLTVKDAPYPKKKLVLLTLINNLTQLCLISKKTSGQQQSFAFKSIDKLLEMAISLILCKIPRPFHLYWPDILQPIDNKYAILYGKEVEKAPSWSLDKFLASFLKNEFSEFENSVFEGNGCLVVKQGKGRIAPVNADKIEMGIINNKLAENLFIRDWNLHILSDKKSQIKDSRKDEIEVIENSVESIIEDQKKCVRSVRPAILKTYADGDLVPVEIIEVGASNFTVRTIDPGYDEITAKLVFETNLHIFRNNYPLEMWLKALTPGTIITATYNEGTRIFSLTEQFIEYIQFYVKGGYEFSCKYFRDVQPDEGFYEFISEEGYVIFAPVYPSQHEKMDEEGNVVIEALYFDEKRFRGCIKGRINKIGNDAADFDKDEVRIGVIRDFIEEISENASHSGDQSMFSLDKYFIKEICYTLNVIQSRESNPIKRYRRLCVAKLLCNMAGFEQESLYIDYLSKFIKNLVLFARADMNENTSISEISIPEGLEDNETVASGKEILEILSLFSRADDARTNAALDEYISASNGLVSRTASLVQSYNRLREILDEKTLKGIKRKILEGLSVLIDGDSDLDLANRKEVNFGEEDDTKEFKHSFLFAPNKALEQRQEYTVCKAVCGLMNNQGGVVYLGVGEDQDGLGRPVGLDGDLQELSRRILVRPSLDDYLVYINRRGEEYLGETAWSYVTLRQDREYNIVKIYVEPYPYDVVYMSDGKAFLRKNNSTDEIKEESTFEDIRRRRQKALRKIDDKFIVLQDAIKRKLKVRLLGYHSPDNENISNRVVEPFSIEDFEHVLCYEPAADKVQIFQISRIDKISITEEHWADRAKHLRPFIDIFNIAGESSSKKGIIPVKLNLDTRAKEALCRMYPKAKGHVTPSDKKTWLFEASINNIIPLMHFYFLHAPGIEIVEAPGLLESLRTYISRHIGI